MQFLDHARGRKRSVHAVTATRPVPRLRVFTRNGTVTKICVIEDNSAALKTTTTLGLGVRGVVLSDTNTAVYFGATSTAGARRCARLGADLVFQVATSLLAKGVKWETRLTVPANKTGQ